jgi:lipopolysaccharide transport system ATP-binding protein
MKSNELAINSESLEKVYRIGVGEKIQDNFLGEITNFLKSPLKNYRKYRSLYRFDDLKSGKDPGDVIWALRDISFEVKKGEVVGIIGLNGAGKSTLLKILSGITDPTAGRALIRGRVSSLLEVGTGFHPELTGRDNVYLNGTILGMRKKEIDIKFDEIVEFSGIGKFIDTPVKRYSSGMKVRLAFSVGAHLEPEILIVDEVLAVGDIAFQKKCLGKMEDIRGRGRTVLFVSHNMPSIARLCPRAILLNEGRIVADGPCDKVIGEYLLYGQGAVGSRQWPEGRGAPGDEVTRLRAVRIRRKSGLAAEFMDIHDPIGLEMEFDVLQPGYQLFPYYSVHNQDGVRVMSVVDRDPQWQGVARQPGRYTTTAWIPGNLLSEGTFFVDVAMRAPEMKIRHFNERQIIAFQVVDDLSGNGARGIGFGGKMAAVIRPLLDWETRFSPNGTGALPVVHAPEDRFPIV